MPGLLDGLMPTTNPTKDGTKQNWPNCSGQRIRSFCCNIIPPIHTDTLSNREGNNEDRSKTLSADTEINHLVLNRLLQNALGLTAPLNTNIHENDQMFSYSASARGNTSMARSEYFTSGVQLLKLLEQLIAWKFGSPDKVSSFLDFASGYGRLIRFLVHKLPADRIWVSDIQADAVAFQQ